MLRPRHRTLANSLEQRNELGRSQGRGARAWVHGWEVPAGGHPGRYGSGSGHGLQHVPNAESRTCRSEGSVLRSPRHWVPALGAVVALGVTVLAPLPASARRASPAASTVAPDLIGFEADPPGFGIEPWPSRDNPTVRFITTGGSAVENRRLRIRVDGRGLRFGGGGSIAIIVFDVPTRRLSLRFGNDTPEATQPGDRATLTVFRNDRRVARKHVTLNRNGDGDHFIEYRGARRSTELPSSSTEMGARSTSRRSSTISRSRKSARSEATTVATGWRATPRPTEFCGKGGADRIAGHGANDLLVGGGGPDRIIDGYGADLIVGGPGDDTLGAGDHTNDGDTFYPGPGNDTCIVDDDDVIRGTCETVSHRIRLTSTRPCGLRATGARSADQGRRNARLHGWSPPISIRIGGWRSRG